MWFLLSIWISFLLHSSELVRGRRRSDSRHRRRILTISGRVPCNAYTRLPTAWYGICSISFLSFSLLGDISLVKIWSLAQGVLTSWLSYMLNLDNICLIYVDWSRVMVSLLRSRVILMPRIWCASPRSFILKRCLKSFFNVSFSPLLLERISKSSTLTAAMRSLGHSYRIYKDLLWISWDQFLPVLDRVENSNIGLLVLAHKWICLDGSIGFWNILCCQEAPSIFLRLA